MDLAALPLIQLLGDKLDFFAADVAAVAALPLTQSLMNKLDFFAADLAAVADSLLAA